MISRKNRQDAKNCIVICIEAERLPVSPEFERAHRVVLTIPRPEFSLGNRGGGADQRVTQLHMMTLRVLTQIIARAPANFTIDGDDPQCGKQRFERSVFAGPRAMP